MIHHSLSPHCIHPSGIPRFARARPKRRASRTRHVSRSVLTPSSTPVPILRDIATLVDRNRRQSSRTRVTHERTHYVAQRARVDALERRARAHARRRSRPARQPFTRHLRERGRSRLETGRFALHRRRRLAVEWEIERVGGAGWTRFLAAWTGYLHATTAFAAARAHAGGSRRTRGMGRVFAPARANVHGF